MSCRQIASTSAWRPLASRSARSARFSTSLRRHEELAASSNAKEESLEQRRAAMRAEVDRKKASFQAKYAERLQQKAREAGVESIEELRMKRLLAAASAKANNSRAARPAAASAAASATPQASSSRAPAQAGSPDAKLPIRPLGSILDLDKVRADNLDAEAIGKLWTGYHSLNTSYLSAVIPVATYRKMLATASLYPEFVVPLARGEDGQGVEMWLLQWSRPTASASTVLFTPLAAYHARGTYAPPALILTHYSEMTGSHGLALMRGERTEEAEHLLTADEAKVLVWRLQRFYNTVPGETSADGQKYRALLEDFHRPRREGDQPFDVAQLASIAHEV